MPEGLRLLPDVEAYLDRVKGGKPRSAMSVEETRQAMLAGRVHQAPAPFDIAVCDAEANGVPVRLYGDISGSALLYFHGGRFFSGNLETHDLLLRELAGRSGVGICAVDYRLAPEHPYPAALEDAVRAAAWLSERVARLAVGGDSAGAGLAAALAASGEAPPLVWQMLLYPMLDATCSLPSYAEFFTGPWAAGEDMKRGWDLYVPAGADPRDPRISPLFAPDYRRFPPAYLVTAEVDSLRDEALQFAANLRAAGVPVEHHHEEGMIHGYFTMTAAFSRARESVTTTAAALRSALGPPSV